MIEDIELNREKLQALGRRFHVRRLDPFGSAARGDFDPARSDIDCLVDCENTAIRRTDLEQAALLSEAWAAA